jgi:acyl carrier protein
LGAVALAKAAGAELHNLYGPTEASVDVTWWPCATREDHAVPIGKPIANTSIYVLDRDLQPAPTGVAGELYIGGVSLARGYVGRPGLTTESFRPDPFGGRLGGSIYATGDLARWLPDGNVQYLGRRDHQVKIRGFRIELGEIEARLNGHPGVRQAVVVQREDQPGERTLAAYVVPEPDAVLNVSEIRHRLEQQLPRYMVPAHFVFLPALPTTTSGKLDRRALPVPDEGRPELEETFVAPRTPTEETIAAIWADVLRLEKVGVHDNYFDLGGDSLLATQIFSRVRGVYDVQIPLRALLEKPTVAGLAEQIDSASASGDVHEPRIAVVAARPAYPLSFAQERLWVADQLDPGNTAFNLSVAMRLRGALHAEALQRSLDEIAARQQSLRTVFTTVDGTPSQVVRPRVEIALPLVDLQSLSEPGQSERVHQLAVEYARRPFDLSEGPLLRTHLLRLGEDDHVLQVIMHHIISDGWSMGVFLKEVNALYEAYAHGQPSPLPPLPVQYGDVSVWQREYLQGERYEQLVSYWQKQLEGSPVTEWPTDKPRPAVFSYRGAHESFSVPRQIAERIHKLGQQEGVTLFMLLLTAFKALIHHATGQPDIVVSAASAGRNRAEVEGLIGFFVNLLLLRTDLSGNPGFRELLGRVRNTTLDALKHQDLPFDRLVSKLRWNRDLSSTSVAGINFSFQNLPFRAVTSSAVRGTGFEVRNGTSRFDLSLMTVGSDRAIEGTVIYNTDLYERSTIESLVHLYQTLLRTVALKPDIRLSDLRALVTQEIKTRRGMDAAALKDAARLKLAGARRSRPGPPAQAPLNPEAPAV